MYTTFSFTVELLREFQVLAIIISNAAVNIHVHVFEYECSFFPGQISGTGIAGSTGNLCLTF